MFGWEFPPLSSGGLGTACQGLTRGLSNNNVEITFVLPYAPDSLKPSHLKMVSAGDYPAKFKVKMINSPLKAYITSAAYAEYAKEAPKYTVTKVSDVIYGSNLFEEVYRYAQKAKYIAMSEDFDIIHCHDWMTFQAGIEAKKASSKPLVIQVHATEFDRTGGSVNQLVYNLEREGMHAADSVIAVSQFTKNKIVDHYGIDPEKVHVVHNAVEFTKESSHRRNDFALKQHEKLVLFLGRITLQKGPDYFVYAAKKVLEHDPNVKFVIVGKGDMEHFIINKIAELGIADKVLFTGFLSGPKIDEIYQMADVYVMPSVSEPFGITPLEAMRNGTPVIISRQSGVSEVVDHCLKVDFWDINQLANKILSVLNYKSLHSCLQDNGYAEVNKFSWNESAKKCISVYEKTKGIA
jgi:glycosyltransferase involved in cell wall biosynthesis